MIWSDFLKTHSQEVVIFGYLDMLAERTVRLEQRLGLHEIQQLQAENQQLRQRLAKLDTPSIEQLLDFLPAFFLSFWTKISPEELARLVGSKIPKMPLVISSTEKSSTLLMHYKFLELSVTDQTKIANFCIKIQKSHNLRWHPLAPNFAAFKS